MPAPIPGKPGMPPAPAPGPAPAPARERDETESAEAAGSAEVEDAGRRERAVDSEDFIVAFCGTT